MKKELAVLNFSKKELKPKHDLKKNFLPKNAKPSMIESGNIDYTKTYAQHLTPLAVSALGIFAGTYMSLLQRNGFNDPNFSWDMLVWGLSIPASVILGITTSVSWSGLSPDWASPYRFYASNNFDFYYSLSERTFGEKGGSQSIFRKGSNNYDHYKNNRGQVQTEGYTKTVEIKRPSRKSFFDPTSLFRPKKISHYISYDSSDGKYTEHICYVHGFRTKKVVKTYESEMSLFDLALKKVASIHFPKA